MNLRKVKRIVESNGGATLTSSLDNATINDGYMVSLQGNEFKTSLELLTSNLLETYQQTAENNNAYIGFWLDNQELYVDISINIHDYMQAVQIARDNEQLAIYNCRTGESIYL